MPVVVSVLIFVIYYIIDSGATRVAKSGEMNMVLGVWMSTIVLAPIGAFFTYKSNNDSVVFNAEVYINFFRMLLGLRPSRHVFKKELIIEECSLFLLYQPSIYLKIAILASSKVRYVLSLYLDR